LKRNFEEAVKQGTADFKRDTGITHENYEVLTSLVRGYLENYFVKYPNRTKGVKPGICTEDWILLTLYYLRHYVTFKNLGDNFGISGSYANKLYRRMPGIFVNVLHVKGEKYLMDSDLDVIVVDVCEQPIERPVSRQKKYYSGKKKTYGKNTADHKPVYW